MRVDYFQRIRLDDQNSIATLDGSVGGAGRKFAQDSLAVYRKRYPGANLEVMPATLHWAEDSSWQALSMIRLYDHPGLLERILVRDPPARLTGKTQTSPCFIWWALGDIAYEPLLVCLSEASANDVYSQNLAAKEASRSRYRLTEGQLSYPANIQLVAGNEHKVWIAADVACHKQHGEYDRAD